ncbi:hypothetical protein P8H26_02630 [Pseudochrobactrum sp. sp1633]|uniref:hypothetical protein n=1 Tax=Pseudochrobactrum sp. sp1633 TaxID=3036706 RepID=UPI0025A52CC1|nr:hypothetical protein [Pseudochrobactrum sp. sp1633]MDM8344283.1 hypothetical protein [Pseudochrobactrum sp. sp1633]HWD14584.1 hypothetical protein [Pseudochrobactrum sp.]
MSSAINSIIRLPYRLALFLLAFMMLQLCAFQMSAQAYAPALSVAANLSTMAAPAHKTMNHSAEHKAPSTDQHHSTKGMACSVSGCVVPVPVPPVMTQIDAIPRVLTAPSMQTLHGLPPALSDRPPISVSA